ncbi:MAG: retroviral-like aspartic protease family protein, partial [Acidobacteriota bacterium]|nr:retroviral-like aspartic protease family protein [Acidobacteriota bacterium]
AKSKNRRYNKTVMIKLASKRIARRNYKTGVNEMGLVYAELDLLNGGDVYLFRQNLLDEIEIKRVNITALVDTGAYMLSINENIKTQLDLPVIEKQFVTLADDSTIEVEIVGPVEVRFENRRTSVDAVVLPGDAEVLLGAIPMEDMDVLVDPRQQKLVVNPKHPYVATKYLK